MLFPRKQNLFSNKASQGFTLVELLIVSSIFIMMTALLVANYRKFGNNVTLANIAYEVSQSIREVQTYGLSSRASGSGSETGTDSIFRKRYGFYMGSANQFILFADQNNNSYFDGDTTDSVLRSYTLPADLTFSMRCVAGGAGTVSPAPIHMTFFRPNPDATIKKDTTAAVYGRAKICLTSANSGKSMEIDVYGSGQIEVLNVNSCVCS